MDNLEPLSFEELDSRCRLAWDRLYRNLSPLIGRTQPVDFARAMCKHLHDVETSFLRPDLAPHFVVALAIELNCVMARSYCNEPVTLTRYEKIIRKIIGFNDPNDYHLLDNDLHLFTLKLFRRQLPFQHSTTMNVLYRVGQSLIYSPVLNPVHAWFEKKYGVSPKDWFIAGCVYASTGFTRGSLYNNDPMGTARALKLSKLAMDSVAEEASMTPQKIKQEWENKRKDAPYREHFNIPSVFHSHPIINYGDDQYFVPFPFLMFTFMEKKLQEIYKEHPKGGLKIGSAVEQYVVNFLRASKVATSIRTQAEIKERVRSGPSCDIVAFLPDCTLLIEVKATGFSRDKFSASTIQKDTSTKTIAKAYKQLIETARSLFPFGDLRDDRNVSNTVIGIVVTAWDIPSVNAPDYHDQYIHEADATLWRSGDLPPTPFSFYPTTMEIGTFELLCEHLANGKSLLGFCEERAARSYGVVGEWRNYLANISKEDGYPPRLDVVEQEWNTVFPVRKPR